MRIAAGAATDAEHLPSGSTTGAKRREKGRGGAASAKHLPEAANPRGDANLKAASHGGFFVGASRSEVRTPEGFVEAAGRNGRGAASVAQRCRGAAPIPVGTPI